MSRVTHQNNFIYLTVALIALLLVSALGHSLHLGLGVHFGQGMILLTLAVTFYTLDFGWRWRRFVAGIFVLCLLITLLSVLSQLPEITLLYRLVSLIFFLVTTIVCGHQVLFSTTSASNAIVGTLALYLLLGIVWAILYSITLYFLPGAFKGVTPTPGEDPFPRLLYFSYVTLATLGYGDVSPAEPISKTLAYLQAVTGTFYLAIIVASLIGSRLKR